MSVEAEVRAEVIRQFKTITALSAEVGMKRPYLSLRLNEHKEFTSGELSRIGRALGVPAWELIRRAEQNREGQER